MTNINIDDMFSQMLGELDDLTQALEAVPIENPPPPQSAHSSHSAPPPLSSKSSSSYGYQTPHQIQVDPPSPPVLQSKEAVDLTAMLDDLCTFEENLGNTNTTNDFLTPNKSISQDSGLGGVGYNNTETLQIDDGAQQFNTLKRGLHLNYQQSSLSAYSDNYDDPDISLDSLSHDIDNEQRQAKEQQLSQAELDALSPVLNELDDLVSSLNFLGDSSPDVTNTNLVQMTGSNVITDTITTKSVTITTTTVNENVTQVTQNVPPATTYGQHVPKIVMPPTNILPKPAPPPQRNNSLKTNIFIKNNEKPMPPPLASKPKLAPKPKRNSLKSPPILAKPYKLNDFENNSIQHPAKTIYPPETSAKPHSSSNNLIARPPLPFVQEIHHHGTVDNMLMLKSNLERSLSKRLSVDGSVSGKSFQTTSSDIDSETASVQSFPESTNESQVIELHTQTSDTQVDHVLNKLEEKLEVFDGNREETDEEREERQKSEKVKVALEKLKEARIQKLVVKVYNKDDSSKTLMVDERMNCRGVMKQLIEKNHFDFSPNWTLIEELPSLYMERMFEEHENPCELLSHWTRDTTNRIRFVERKDKYALFKNPQHYLLSSSDQQELMQERQKQTLIEEFFSGKGPSSGVPEVESFLHIKSEGKSWSRKYCVLRSSGLYFSKSGEPKKGKKVSDLQCLVIFDQCYLYLGRGWKKKYKSPFDYGFALKHPAIQMKSKSIRYLCCEDFKSFMKWTIGIRLAKYGRKLLENYEKTNEELKSQSSISSTFSFKPQPQPDATSLRSTDSGGSNSQPNTLPRSIGVKNIFEGAWQRANQEEKASDLSSENSPYSPGGAKVRAKSVWKPNAKKTNNWWDLQDEPQPEEEEEVLTVLQGSDRRISTSSSSGRSSLGPPAPPILPKPQQTSYPFNDLPPPPMDTYMPPPPNVRDDIPPVPILSIPPPSNNFDMPPPPLSRDIPLPPPVSSKPKPSPKVPGNGTFVSYNDPLPPPPPINPKPAPPPVSRKPPPPMIPQRNLNNNNCSPPLSHAQSRESLEDDPPTFHPPPPTMKALHYGNSPDYGATPLSNYYESQSQEEFRMDDFPPPPPFILDLKESFSAVERQSAIQEDVPARGNPPNPNKVLRWIKHKTSPKRKPQRNSSGKKVPPPPRRNAQTRLSNRR